MSDNGLVKPQDVRRNTTAFWIGKSSANPNGMATPETPGTLSAITLRGGNER
ncbi:MAG: hypothetical protein L6371_05065 [Candidatus Atribacteria bacterium]|nr:hypothetical protein [Candidatus Atribacteria bacterium]